MTESHEIIRRTVDAFYAKARTDIFLGYHFARIADFSTHLPRIYAFWELQLIGKSEFHFSPPLDVLRAHMPLHIHTGEVNRWIKLFHETLNEISMPAEFRELWREKLNHFQQIFLRSPLLFSSPD